MLCNRASPLAAPCLVRSAPRCHARLGRKCSTRAAGGGSTSTSWPVVERLPVFPVQPIGVFLPGMTKTLHLYEAHLNAMLEEAMAGAEHQLFATAVLEPYMGESGPEGLQQSKSFSPGAFVGGYNFSLSCGTLCKVISSKPFPGGYLVKIRGEARLGISGLDQTEPFLRADVFPMADAPVLPRDMPHLREKLEELQEIMRDVQNLASKFRCDETASIQQAMRWVHMGSLLPSVVQMPEGSLMAGPEGSASPSTSISATASSTTSTSSQGLHQQEPGEQEAGSVDAGEAAMATTAGSGPGLGATQGPGQADEEGEEPSGDQEDAEFASRLSFAALQWLPQSTQSEKVEVQRGRLLAMDTLSVLDRLEIACEVMSEQRNSLVAKIALKTLRGPNEQA